MELSTASECFFGDKICENWSVWMKGISDSKSLKDMSIPGTHDSMAFYGGDFFRCQSMSLYNQYVAGIRFVDIRCRHINNGFAIHHEKVYQQANFDDVLQQTFSFLSDHPSETVVMSVKEEYEPEKNSRSFEDTLKEYIAEYTKRKFQFHDGKDIPKLGKVRGRIVFLRRFSGSTGIDFDSQQVQDDWIINTILPASITPKIEGCIGNMEAAKNDSNRNRFYITFCSASSGTSSNTNGASPSAVASRVNIHIKRHVQDKEGCFGIVIYDFPGSLASYNIFMTNPGSSI